ncbi:hypothetical protein WJX77_007872 [Trebouxia sp. C0004]
MTPERSTDSSPVIVTERNNGNRMYDRLTEYRGFAQSQGALAEPDAMLDIPPHATFLGDGRQINSSSTADDLTGDTASDGSHSCDDQSLAPQSDCDDYFSICSSEWSEMTESDDFDIDVDYFGYNPATDQMLDNIDQDDQAEAAGGCLWAWRDNMEEDGVEDENASAEWKEPRVRSAHWFALRKDQSVYQGMLSLAGVQEETPVA